MIRSSLTLIVFVGAMVFLSARLFRQIPYVKEEVNDMSLYYKSYPQNIGYCCAGCGPGEDTEINGKTLFKANCASCHKVDKVLIGPALMGAKQRWSDAGIPDKIYDWIRNPKATLDQGHPYVKGLVERFNTQALMTPHALTNEEIDAIMTYLE